MIYVVMAYLLETYKKFEVLLEEVEVMDFLVMLKTTVRCSWRR
jgi:hypothetical protein